MATINNTINSKTISGGDGDDTITNSGNNVYIDAGEGRDTIKNSGVGTTIWGGGGNDSVYNYRRSHNAVIYGDSGKNYINNMNSDGVSIYGGVESDYVTINSSASIYAEVNDGQNQVLVLDSNNVTIVGGSEKDYFTIQSGCSNVSVKGGADTDYIRNYASVSAIHGDDGNDWLYNGISGSIVGGDYVSMDGGAGDDNIRNYGQYALIYGGEGKDDLTNYSNGKNSSLYGGAGDDKLYNGVNSSIVGGDYVRMDGGAGNDRIINYGQRALIYGGDGKDSLYNYSNGKNSSLFGGDGDDYIYNNSTNTTIDGGKGNDRVLINYSSTNALYGREDGLNVFVHSVGDGNDSLENFKYGDSVYLASGRVESVSSTVRAGKYYFDFKIGDETLRINTPQDTTLITFVYPDGTKQIYENGKISSKQLSEFRSERGSNARDQFQYDGTVRKAITNFSAGTSDTSDVIFFSGGKLSSMKRDTGNLLLTMTNGNYLYVSTGLSITADMEIMYTTDGTNISTARFGGNEMTVYSGSSDAWYAGYKGVDYSQDAKVKFYSADRLMVKGSGNNNIWLDGSKGTRYSIKDIDARSSTGQNTLVGNSASNTIYAGSGGTTLWGGSGKVADYLVGSTGADVFFYGKNDGDDVITGDNAQVINSNAMRNNSNSRAGVINAVTSDDTINLYDVRLSDIVSGEKYFAPKGGPGVVSWASTKLTFNTGNTLVVEQDTSLSPVFKLADGSKYQFNLSTSRWSRA